LDGKPIQVSSRVRIIEAYTSHTLLISRSEIEDGGTYAVTISNKHGRQTSTASVYIKGSSRPKQLKSTNSRMAGGSKLDKTAASRLVSGNIWTRNSSTPASGITNATGGAPPRRRGPGFILRPKPKTVSIGESLNLKCTLLGHPKPTVTWEKDGELVDEERTDGHIRTRIDGNNYFLEIDKCRVGDGGKYAVTARNSLGKQMAGAEVTIVRDTNGSNSMTSKNTVTTCSSNLTTTKPIVETSRKTIENKKDDVITSSKMYIHTSSKLVNEMTNVPTSPTGSVSSSISVQSKQSSTSSRSNCSGGEAVGKSQPILIEQQEVAEIRRKSILQAPTITRRLSSTQVLEGEELLLQCDISGDSQLELQWLRNGVEFHEDQVFVSFRNGVARLRLRDVQLRHAGEYMCVARNDAGEVKCSSRVTVKAKPIDKCPRFFKSLNDVRAVEGETLKLEAGVEANPVPEIFWSLDGQEIQDAECSFTNNIARLVIKNVTMASSGQYMCNAINTSGEDSVACRVRIKERKLNIRPEFTAPLSDVTLKKDATLCLRCMVTGIPEPTVNWRCNDEIIDDYEGVEVTFQDGVAALKLDKAQTDDSGVYSCVATNCEGEGATRCIVKVEDDSQVKEEKIINSVPKFIQRFDEFLRVQEGDEITLNCAFTGCPEPLVTWTSNGKLIEDAEVITEPGKSFLVISKVTMGLNGPIKCSLSNTLGKSEHESRLSVRSRRAAPTIEKELPNTLEIIEGESGQMSCKVHGHPQPRVSWTRDGRSLSILTTETTYENGEATVKIRKASTRDSGKYVCTARNLSGDIQTLCQVLVKPKVVEEIASQPKVKPPKFVKKMTDIELEDGQDLKLECVIESDPVATISWQVDGDSSSLDDCDTNFHNGIASLFLEDVMKEDSGFYTCIAENEAGKVTCSCKVEVKIPDNKKCEDNSEITSNGVQSSTESREPTFLVQLADMTVKEGDDIKLHCQIGGNPPPQVTWLLDGEGIVEAEIKNDEDGNHELILVESLLDDEGVYTCIAENKYKRVMSSCKVTIQAALENEKNRSSDDVTKNQVCSPEFIRSLSDARIADGSKDFRLTCHVTGNPQPTAQWFFNDEEIVDCDDFHLVDEGKMRSLVFAEVFPEDTGSYSCVIRNAAGKAESSCNLTVEEIEGEAPNFHNKPRPITANIGEKAIFSCQINGDPQPIVTWMFNGQELSESDNIHIVDSNADNNHTNSLEIGQVTALDAGRYSVTCSNLLGNITCTVSLIVNDVKNQETKTDFRNVLKKTQMKASPGITKETNASDEQMDFRGVLRKKSTERAMTSSESDDSSNQEVSNLYKEALSTQVKTKALTEDERKKQKAEQLDFRSTLVRKVDPKITNQEVLKSRQPSQQDFRDEALKTHVQTKQIGQDEIKKMQAEQVDFRPEAIKTKVLTKAYKEENVKTRKVEQVDFRTVLSPTRKEVNESLPSASPPSIAEIPRAKWKRNEGLDNNTVSTKRSRNRTQNADKRTIKRSDEVEELCKPTIKQALEDLEATDGSAFQLMCLVAGNPKPEVKWYLDNEEIKPDSDIEIKREGERCMLLIGECLPDDEGVYVCKACNEVGEASSTARVTIIVSSEGSAVGSPTNGESG